MTRIYINDDWQFTEYCTQGFIQGKPAATVSVRLPHTSREVPYNYFDESLYQMDSGYRRSLFVPEEWMGKRILLTVEAAGHFSCVYVNGEKIKEHRCGYTAYQVELTTFVKYGQENTLVIEVDSRETLNQPPFGYVIDYMTYGGLYRQVYLDIKEPVYIEDVFARPRINGKNGIIYSDIEINGPLDRVHSIRQSACLDTGGQWIVETSEQPHLLKTNVYHFEFGLPDVKVWDLDHPNCYLLQTEILDEQRNVIDRKECTIGFRTAEWKADGFYLNGTKTKIVGLNRHQSYPYVGYAMPESMQRMDADLIKKELGCNAVRTSHYPQSQFFIDQCDHIGLLVFTEIPGWQHIGNDTWKQIAADNTRDMILQYRNHPSIILWGVRINESNDDDTLYRKTNTIAHHLDPTRSTGGVRCIKKSHLLEDVYTYNDFSHEGDNRGCLRKRDVTPDMDKAYLISEYNGHMYPTKTFDSEDHRTSHVLRHAAVLDEVFHQKDIAGSFGWCMFDYNTHQDFGSGDRICYHGVMDMFRNPKQAASVYACFRKDKPVLEITSAMDIGEHPSGNPGKVYIITNCDNVHMYKNDQLIKTYKTKDSKYTHLEHGPILVDDYIGDAMIGQEDFTSQQMEDVKYILNYCAMNGFSHLSPRVMGKAARLMARYKMKFEDAYALYGKYIGDWGKGATVYRFEGVKDGKIVKTVTKTPVTSIHMDIQVDHTELQETNTYDVAAIRIVMKDQMDNVLPFYQGVVNASSNGPVEIVGPRQILLRGGMGGTYLKTTGQSGQARLILTNEQAEMKILSFTVIDKKGRD